MAGGYTSADSEMQILTGQDPVLQTALAS